MLVALTRRYRALLASLRRLRRRRTLPAVCIVRQTDLYELPLRREAEALVSAGFDVDVICMHNPERPRRSVVNGVTIIGLPASLGRKNRIRYAADYGWFFLLAMSVLAVRQLRRRYVAVQVNTMPDFLVFAAFIPKLLGSRVIAYMNEPIPELAETLFGSRRLTRILERFEQSALRFADHAVTVTAQLKDRYVERGADPDRITVVLNGADAETLLGAWKPPPATGHDTFTVICHGSIEERYGQDTIIDAVRLLRAELPDLRVVFVGRGTGVDGVMRMIVESGLSGAVRFAGWVTLDQLNDLLCTADVGVVAQKASPYSHLVHTNKMIDYWIHGLPVIASRLHAVSELYDDSVLEYYDAGDAASLASAIRRLHNDPARRAELARNGILASQANGWGTQRRRYLAVYENLLRN